MAITKLDTGKKRWRVDWRDPSGKRRRKSFATKREAVAFQDGNRREVSLGNWVDPDLASKTIVMDIYEKWLERVQTRGARGKGGARPKTVHNYKRFWETHIEPRWAFVPLDQVEYGEVSDWVATMATGTRTRYEVGVIFGRILDEAVRAGVLPKNPARDRTGRVDYLPKLERQGEHIYLTAEQLNELVEAMPTLMSQAQILLAGLSGLRWGEVTALRPEDLDLEKGLARVRRAWSDVGGRLILGPTKNGSARTVPLHGPTLEVLRSAATDFREGEWVFTSPRGAALRNGNFTKRVLVPALESLGELPQGLRFHDLRHTAVSLAISSGANIKVVQAIAGHASAKLTLDTYAGLFVSDLMESAERVNGHIASAFGESDGHFLDT